MYESWAENEDDAEGAVVRIGETASRKAAVVLALLVGGVLFLFGARLAIGDYSVGAADALAALWRHLTEGPDGSMLDNVVWKQRLPRAFTAVIAGMGLAAAGAAMQSLMKNPLADPYTAGISSGALFGATLSMTLGIGLAEGYFGRVANAFVFAMVPALVIAVIPRWRKPSPAMMILAGIAIMYIFNAFQSYMMLKADPNSASSVYTWSVGSIGMTTWSTIPVMAGTTIAGCAMLMLMSRALNAMNAGDDYARSLGIPIDGVRILCLGLVSFVAAGIVSFTGVIGFVGLVSPHIARMLIGPDNRLLIPASALMGALMMLLCDIVGFLIMGSTLQIGVVTAMIGGPLFMAILLTRRGEVW